MLIKIACACAPFESSQHLWEQRDLRGKRPECEIAPYSPVEKRSTLIDACALRRWFLAHKRSLTSQDATGDRHNTLVESGGFRSPACVLPLLAAPSRQEEREKNYDLFGFGLVLYRHGVCNKTSKIQTKSGPEAWLSYCSWLEVLNDRFMRNVQIG